MREASCLRFDQACELLPMKWQLIGKELPDAQKRNAEEIRLRVGRDLSVLSCGREVYAQTGETVSQGDLEQLCDILCGYSRYAVTQTMAQGFLSAPGGFRVGLCGTAVMSQGVCSNLRDISSACIRIGTERPGISEHILRDVFAGNIFPNTLILSPPGGGKTTLLRDMVRGISTGTAERPFLRVGLVDERGEIAGMYNGAPQFDVGTHTDILDACPKALAMEMLLRTMNPQLIALDEITASRDLQAMENACHCGVALLATIHAKDLAELFDKPLYTRLMKMHVFSRAVVISHRQGKRSYHMEAL